MMKQEDPECILGSQGDGWRRLGEASCWRAETDRPTAEDRFNE